MLDLYDENKDEEKDTVYVDTLNQGPYVNTDELSNAKYNLIIGLTLFWGFFINVLIVGFLPLSFYEKIDPLLLFVGYFISCIAGILMSKLSSNPIISFIGYNLVVLPMGIVLNLTLIGYGASIILRAATITGVVTFLMMILSATFPNFFAGLGKSLGITLLISFVVEVLSTFLFPAAGVYIDYFVILIFCGYIGYDWYIANRLPKTVDNAVDCATNIYVDIINLFIRILSASARRKR